MNDSIKNKLAYLEDCFCWVLFSQAIVVSSLLNLSHQQILLPFSTVINRPLLSRIHRAKSLLGIVVKSLLGHCCQEFVGALMSRVCWVVVAKSLSGHCCQEFVGPLLPRVCRIIVVKNSSGHYWQMVSWGTIGKADISNLWPTVSFRNLPVLA